MKVPQFGGPQRSHWTKKRSFVHLVKFVAPGWEGQDFEESVPKIFPKARSDEEKGKEDSGVVAY